MRQITIGPNEAGQRLDKFLHKYMKEAPTSFLYKMLRKKNITLNGAKCAGNERLSAGDILTFFLAEETLEAFGAAVGASPDTGEYLRAWNAFGALQVIYEDAHILAVNKPAGILSQKAEPGDLSLNEWLIGYLLREKRLDAQSLRTFHPSVCNRLDRNTCGLVLCAGSLEGAQLLTALLRDRSIRKFYRLMVKGRLQTEEILEAWLVKEARTNQVRILAHGGKGAERIRTGIHPICCGTLPDGSAFSYVEAELFTGKTHQIRAQFSAIGHPLLGDYKYGDPALNEACRELGVKNQLLCAYRVEFPDSLPAGFAALQGRKLCAPLPPVFQRLSGFLC